MNPSEVKPGTERVAFRRPLAPSSGLPGVFWGPLEHSPAPAHLYPHLTQSPCPLYSSHTGLFLSFKKSSSFCYRVPFLSSLCLNVTCWGTSPEHPLMVAPPSQYTSLISISILVRFTAWKFPASICLSSRYPTSIEGPWKMTLVCLMDHCTPKYWNSAWHILGIQQILVNLMHA